MPPNIIDVRDQMPNYENYKHLTRDGKILGIAIHHSATASRSTGAPTGDAFSFFSYHVNGRGWLHGGYNYVITGDGTIQYALDDKISAYHAGFKDPSNAQGLEYGQYWNNHYLAICLAGWFAENRTYQDERGTQQIPNSHTRPTQAQFDALLALIKELQGKYQIPVENVRGHRELAGNSTQCPGLNLDPAQIRAQLRQVPQPQQPKPTPGLGEHVILIPDTDEYFTAALSYIWKFQPDTSFAPQTAAGRWPYVTAIGQINDDLLAAYRQQGAVVVDHIPGTPETVTQKLDALVADNRRFLPEETPPEEPPDPAQPTQYQVQPGDSLSKIAQQFYGKASLWPVIFDANRDSMANPGQLKIGQILKIPPQPKT